MIVFLFGLSMGEIMLIFLVILMLFGSKKIPDLARSLGKGFNEFRRAADDIKREFDKDTTEIREDLHLLQGGLREKIDETRELIDASLREKGGSDLSSNIANIDEGNPPRIVILDSPEVGNQQEPPSISLPRKEHGDAKEPI